MELLGAEPDTGLCFYVNGKEVCVAQPDPEMTLLYFLRKNLHLSGTKLVCGEGGCGACTVMVSHHDREEGRVEHFTVNACLAPLCSVHGMAVTTVEGIGSTQTALHACQERIARAHGSQCGFCTPGFVMSMYTLLRNNPQPTEEEIEGAFEGNLCRCTGYRPILEGYKTFAKGYSCTGVGKDGKCCMAVDGNASSVKGPSVLFDASKFVPLDPTQEPIFPPALKVECPRKPLAISGPRVRWFQPATLSQLLALRSKFPHHTDRGKPQYRMVVGNTEIGVEVRFRGAHYEVLISPMAVPELNRMELQEGGLLVGAAVSLSKMGGRLAELVATLPKHKTRCFSAVLEMLRWFAGNQIRNVCAIGGNICNASPISDINPTLMAAGAKLNLASEGSQRTIVMDSDFFVGYKQTALKPNEVLVSVLIPFTRENEFILSYKQARRRDDDIAIVNAGLRVKLCPAEPHWAVEECAISYGGMSFRTIMAQNTQKMLLGKPWNEATLNEACRLLLEELSLPANVPGGMPEYRQSLVTSFFFKFYLSVLSAIRREPLAKELVSATQLYHREVAKSTQGFQSVPEAQIKDDFVGRPMMHLSALQQATGEARYLDDMPEIQGELHGALVLSARAHATITVDTSEALKMAGVRGFVGVEDVPGSNIIGVVMDEEAFADGRVTCFGQPIGVVVAEDQMVAQRAAKAVRITYQDLPSIITIEDAIAAESFQPHTPRLEQGDVETAMAAAEHVLEGTVRVGGQEHFYLETHGCIAVPKGEDGEMELFASTQGVDISQRMAASALGVPANRIVTRVKRIGGGFGGKETISAHFSTIAAVAAHKFKAPVRLILERNEDMISSGGRHPFLGRYKVAVTSEGRLTAVDMHLYSNGGNSVDLSYGIIERALSHADNVYQIPNARFTGRVCRTNLASNTAFRGFGGPQGMMITEQMMEHVATALKLDPYKFRELNMYRDGDVTPFGQLQPVCHIRRCWSLLPESCRLSERQTAVDEYNRANRWRKRGLALTPTKYGLSFGLLSLNQAGALLHVYTDGSVLLTHGGMEMGQGLHTKMVQVAARCLGVAPEKVFISETSSATVANSSPTAASFSTDLNGMAVKNACDILMERLTPYKDAEPDAGWEAWVKKAYLDRVNLSAQGFHATPNLLFDWSGEAKGNLYSYFSYGAACSEVELDTLTGDFTVLRSDLLMDVGDSINPAIDIGQVEGAFTQGVGLFTLEQYVYLEGAARTPRGQPFTTGPGTYKIPSCSDIPVELNVTLLDRAPNPDAIFSSKGVGEPPLFLAASVFFAIKAAVAAARREGGAEGHFQLDSPATCERIRLACSDHFTQQVCARVDKDAKRWTIEA